jgi:phosphate uptake regulator
VTRGTEARAIINAECFRVLKFYERMADHCETAAKRDDQEAVRAIQAARGAVGDAADVVLTPQQMSELNAAAVRVARAQLAAAFMALHAA